LENIHRGTNRIHNEAKHNRLGIEIQALLS
jgi:hypothetical protein